MIQNRKEAGFASAMFIRMLYSCLVDADFLNTETFMNKGMTERDCGDSISVLYEKCMSGISGWLKNEDRNTINGRRTEILKHCLEMASILLHQRFSAIFVDELIFSYHHISLHNDG